MNYEQGGYHLCDAEGIAGEMQRTLNDWYAKTGQLIGEKYGDEPTGAAER